MRTSLICLPALFVVAPVACDGSDHRPLPVSSREATVPSLDKAAVTSLAMEDRFRLELAESSEYQMMVPSGLALDSVHCRILVGDVVDRAVHIFDIEGNPLQTIFGGGRDTSYMASLNDVEVVHGGLIVVGNLSRSIAVFDDSGVVSAFTPDLPVPDAVLGARLAGGDHVVYEHWFALNSQQNTNEWRGLPLVRAFDLDGKLLYTHGAIGEHDGRNLAQALERGTIATNHDTLWFAQKSTGLLRAYVIGYDEPVREVQLPHFFRANPPRELEAATGRLNAVVEEHVGNFSVDGLGRFWIVQNTGYPSDPDALFRPDQVLSVYGSDGSHLASYDFGLEVLAAVSVGRTQFVVLRDPAPWIRVFRLTLDLPSDGRDCSSVRPA